MTDEVAPFIHSVANWYDSLDQTMDEAISLIELAYVAGYTSVCWRADASAKTQALGQSIIIFSDIAGYPMKRIAYVSQPIQGKTLFL